PVDAQIEWVIGLKSGAGFDYFENYDNQSQSVFNPLPSAVMLTLELGASARIKAVGSDRQPVPGIVFDPVTLYRAGKKDLLRARMCATTSVTTDRYGVATFDWLPIRRDSTRFNVNPVSGYSCADPLDSGTADLIARVRRATRLTGTIRYPNGNPAK